MKTQDYMSIRSLKDIRFIPNKNVIRFILFVISCGIVLLVGINHQINKNKRQAEQELIQSALALYQSNISEKLSIIASSEPFINYIRSGPVSRENLFPQIVSSVRHLEPNGIFGAEITYYQKKGKIFAYGERSPYFINLELCYINRTLDRNIGNCEYNIKLFFDKNYIIELLNRINKNIVYSPSSNRTVNFISNNQLGNFSVVPGEQIPLNLDYKSNQSYQVVAFIFIVIVFLILFAYWNKKSLENILESYIYAPLKDITNLVKFDKEYNNSDLPIEEINFLKNEIISWKNRLEDIKLKEKQTEISNLISKVVHDMRTPLAVIEAVSQRLSYDENTALIQKSVKVLKELGNNTLQLAKGAMLEDEKKLYSLPASLLLIDSISEIKQISKINGIKLSFDITNYGIATSMPRSEFYRIISNVIENAADAIKTKGNLDGEIKISLGDCRHNFISITIADNGIGIDEEILSKVTEEGFTHGKKGGTGFGLFNTFSILKKYGGDVKIKSLINKGTTVELFIPRDQTETVGYCNNITINSETLLIIVDDNRAVLDLWQERIKHNRLKYFSKVADFENAFSEIKTNTNVFFIIDGDLGDDRYTGIDLILKYNFTKKSILCTGNYENEKWLDLCIEHKIKILPKELVSYIPIEYVCLKKAVLIDDDSLTHSYWHLFAAENDIELTCFTNVNAFMEFKQNFLKETPIYIDSELGAGLNGEVEAEIIFKSGFRNIILTTGHTHINIIDYPWIKKIIGKEPEFI